jgi:hypothetical protein
MVVADRLFPVDARQREDADVCRFSGRAISASIRLPGVAIEVWSGDALKTETSTDIDGSYRLALPRGDYRLTAELSGFDSVTREVTIAEGACPQTIDDINATAPGHCQPGCRSGRFRRPQDGHTGISSSKRPTAVARVGASYASE